MVRSLYPLLCRPFPTGGCPRPGIQEIHIHFNVWAGTLIKERTGKQILCFLQPQAFVLCGAWSVILLLVRLPRCPHHLSPWGLLHDSGWQSLPGQLFHQTRSRPLFLTQKTWSRLCKQDARPVGDQLLGRRWSMDPDTDLKCTHMDTSLDMNSQGWTTEAKNRRQILKDSHHEFPIVQRQSTEED